MRRSGKINKTCDGGGKNMNGKIKLGCCIPGGSFMPQGESGTGPSALALLSAGRDAVLDASFDYAEATVGAAMKLSESELAQAKNEGLQIEYFNSFIPGQYRILESRASYLSALEYAKLAAERVAILGGKLIVLGSGAARRRPGGISIGEADEIFTRFCGETADILADFGITLALEPLCKAETNVINTLSEGAAVVRHADRPNFKLLCDAYHMFCAGETAEDALKYISILCHVHVAEPPERVRPGKNDGEYLRTLAVALTGAGYRGGVTAECSFGADIRAEFAAARTFMSEIFGL